MEFMKTYYRDDLRTASQILHSEAIGGFCQLDTWTTHVFSLTPDLDGSDKFHVHMFEVDNEAKGKPPTAEAMAAAIDYFDVEDEGLYGTLGEALSNVTGGYSDDIEGLPNGLKAALDAHLEEDKLEGLSKYARKKYLQAKALDDDDEFESLRTTPEPAPAPEPEPTPKPEPAPEKVTTLTWHQPRPHNPEDGDRTYRSECGRFDIEVGWYCGDRGGDRTAYVAHDNQTPEDTPEPYSFTAGKTYRWCEQLNQAVAWCESRAQGEEIDYRSIGRVHVKGKTRFAEAT